MSKFEEVKGGIAVRKPVVGTGWTVVHAASNLYLASSLRQRRFAEQAREDFLALDVDYTLGQYDMTRPAVRELWTPVYFTWDKRARHLDLDPETCEYYASSSHYGQLIPSAQVAAELRSVVAVLSLGVSVPAPDERTRTYLRALEHAGLARCLRPGVYGKAASAEVTS